MFHSILWIEQQKILIQQNNRLKKVLNKEHLVTKKIFQFKQILI